MAKPPRQGRFDTDCGMDERAGQGSGFNIASQCGMDERAGQGSGFIIASQCGMDERAGQGSGFIIASCTDKTTYTLASNMTGLKREKYEPTRKILN